jgi:septum formation protein
MLLFENTAVLTADTTVVLNKNVLGKPKDRLEAINMLSALSGNEHQVITGVSIRTALTTISFDESTTVRFKHLKNTEIIQYVDSYKPYDKAGAYGIQEWIGMIGIESIEGCYYNVMGLPTKRVYQELTKLGFQ